MSKLYKVARMFQQKLVLASVTNLQNLTAVYQAAQSFGKTKQLWENSGTDPYGDADTDLGKAVDKVVGVASRGYSQATTQGMPTKGQYGYAGFLTNMDKAIQELQGHGPFPSLDPRASNALSALQQALYKARSEFTPVGIPAPGQNITLPQDTIYGTPPAPPGGAAYEAGGPIHKN